MSYGVRRTKAISQLSKLHKMNYYFFPSISWIRCFCFLSMLLTLSFLLISAKSARLLNPQDAKGKVRLGIDVLSQGKYNNQLKNKRIGLVTNHTAISSQRESTIEILKRMATVQGFTLAALFAPEHGLNGSIHAEEQVDNAFDKDEIPIHSLYGKTKRPTAEMLKGINLLIFDIQDIGTRSYTYISTLFYMMEEAAKRDIPLIVLDRPNPINGVIVDGPMLEMKWRSIIGYINVPYCHGMTIGELALFFNAEYKIHCQLTVIPMENWNRKMSFNDTGLIWKPTSPHVPEASTPLYYPATGLLGELSLVNIGVGYTLPFKVIGAPWINAQQFSTALNKQKFPGIHFEPFHFKPFYGKFANEECHGVLLVVTDTLRYKPVCTQYLLIGMLKSLYSAKFKKAVNDAKNRKDMFCKAAGTEEIYRIIVEENNIVWKLRSHHEKERTQFMDIRKKYLIQNYSED